MAQFEHMHLQQYAIGIVIDANEMEKYIAGDDCYIRVFDCTVRI